MSVDNEFYYSINSITLAVLSDTQRFPVLLLTPSFPTIFSSIRLNPSIYGKPTAVPGDISTGVTFVRR